jgi:hypothetical protein
VSLLLVVVQHLSDFVQLEDFVHEVLDVVYNDQYVQLNNLLLVDELNQDFLPVVVQLQVEEEGLVLQPVFQLV